MATCAATSIPRVRDRVVFGRIDCSAGARPNNAVAIPAMPNEKSMTRMSSVGCMIEFASPHCDPAHDKAEHESKPGPQDR